MPEWLIIGKQQSLSRWLKSPLFVKRTGDSSFVIVLLTLCPFNAHSFTKSSKDSSTLYTFPSKLKARFPRHITFTSLSVYK